MEERYTLITGIQQQPKHQHPPQSHHQNAQQTQDTSTPTFIPQPWFGFLVAATLKKSTQVLSVRVLLSVAFPSSPSRLLRVGREGERRKIGRGWRGGGDAFCGLPFMPFTSRQGPQRPQAGSGDSCLNVNGMKVTFYAISRLLLHGAD